MTAPMPRSTRSPSRPLLAAALLLAACGDDGGSPLPLHVAPRYPVLPTPLDDVDLLFVVDSTDSAAGAREELARALPAGLRALATGDLDGDGAQDVLAPRSVHVGVVTADLGGRTEAGSALGCTTPGRAYGDMAALRTAGDPALEGCAAAYPTFQSFERGDAAGAEAAAAAVGCVVRALGGGCPWRMPLFALENAVAPSTFRTSIPYGGQADRANAGFLRPDSLLVAVVVSNQDDCSPFTLVRGDPDDPEPDGEARCIEDPRGLFSTNNIGWELVDILSSREDRLLFVPIAGVPPDLAPAEGLLPAGLDALLADPRMQQRPDPTRSGELLPACEGPAAGGATPARRLVEVARAASFLPPRAAVGSAPSYVRSLCAPDLAPALTLLAAQAAERSHSSCLADTVPLDAAERCELLERTRYDDPPCAEREGREPAAPRPGTCRIEPGLWTIDTGSEEARRHCPDRATPRRLVAPHIELFRFGRLFLECPQIPCATDADCRGAEDPPPLVCEPRSGTCRQGCRCDTCCDEGYRCAGPASLEAPALCVRASP